MFQKSLKKNLVVIATKNVKFSFENTKYFLQIRFYRKTVRRNRKINISSGDEFK